MLDRREAARPSRRGAVRRRRRRRGGRGGRLGGLLGCGCCWRRCAAAARRTTGATARSTTPRHDRRPRRRRRPGRMAEVDHDQRRARQALDALPPAREPMITPNASIRHHGDRGCPRAGEGQPECLGRWFSSASESASGVPAGRLGVGPCSWIAPISAAISPGSGPRRARTPRSSAGRRPAVCRIPRIGACCAAPWPWDPKCSSPARQCRLRTVRGCEHLETEGPAGPDAVSRQPVTTGHNSPAPASDTTQRGALGRPRPPNDTEYGDEPLATDLESSEGDASAGTRSATDAPTRELPVAPPTASEDRIRRVRARSRTISTTAWSAGAPRPVEVSHAPSPRPRSGRAGLERRRPRAGRACRPAQRLSPASVCCCWRSDSAS